MGSKFTRRDLAALLSATPLLAQAPPAEPAADDASIAREKIKANAELIRKFDLPTATEPSFIFKP
ncbi:MAG: hypothetical protein ABI822_17075 [Bryobacteraceae bacterium]